MSSPALAGVAATRDFVIVADRDPADRVDIFRCYHADGSDAWTLRYSAPGNLDYGNSSRATPQVHGDLVILSGALGHLHAVELATGKVRWKKHLRKDFDGADNLPWGFCSSPLVVENRLILNPGGKETSLVALNVETGELLWKAPGSPPGYGSLISATVGPTQQIIGYDENSLGGWDVATGARLWTLKPPRVGDFNVPTPIVAGENLIVATENNGARLYRFDAAGMLQPEAIATSDRLLPDCHSPILIGQRLLGITDRLECLNIDDKLNELCHLEDAAFQEYASLIGSPERVLVTSLKGRLLLVAVGADGCHKLAEMQLLEDEAGLFSHPALVGSRLYVRGSNTLVCLDLAP